MGQFFVYYALGKRMFYRYIGLNYFSWRGLRRGLRRKTFGNHFYMPLRFHSFSYASTLISWTFEFKSLVTCFLDTLLNNCVT